jgi:hypothetical protein
MRDPRQSPQAGDRLRDRVSEVVVVDHDDGVVGFDRVHGRARRSRWVLLSNWRAWFASADVLEVAPTTE